MTEHEVKYTTKFLIERNRYLSDCDKEVLKLAVDQARMPIEVSNVAKMAVCKSMMNIYC